MPPKGKKKAAPKPTDVKRSRPSSKLARKLKITAAEEEEIREAFNMVLDEEEDDDDVIRTRQVRKAMLYVFRASLNIIVTKWALLLRIVCRALGFESTRLEMAEILDSLDPEKDGFVTWENFAAICALKLKCTESCLILRYIQRSRDL